MTEFIRIKTLLPNNNSDKYFFNLTSYNFDDYLPIFSLGIKHIPKPRDLSNEELTFNVNNFLEKLSWKYFFNKRNKPEIEESHQFEIPRNKMIKPFHHKFPYNEIKQDIMALTTHAKVWLHYHPEPSKYRDPLRSLKQFLAQNPRIKIVLSDKNLGMVAIDIVKYNQLVLDHVTSPNYEKVGEFPTNLFYFTPIRKALDQARSIAKLFPTDSPERKYLLDKFGKTGYKTDSFNLPAFHVLPKLHKKGTKLKSRPIVGATNWITTPISKILSKDLQPLIRKTHIVQSSKEVSLSLTNLLGIEFQSFLLVSFDVVSLYTNIIIELLRPLLTSPTHQKMLDFICKNNYFVYDKTCFRQIEGLAMGTNSAPELANLYLLKLLDPAFVNHEQVICYRRFLDDGFFIWHGSRTDLDMFIGHMNTLIKGIEFDWTISNVSVDFLDLKIMKKGNTIAFCTHQKVLNKYAYITPKSCHPLHTIKGFINGELTRYAINSSNRNYYLITKQLFHRRLLQRGYSHNFLAPLFSNHQYTRTRTKKVKPKQTITSLNLRYTHRIGVTRLAQKLIKDSSNIPLLPTGHKPLIAWMKSPNLFNQLCRSKITSDQSEILRSLNRQSGGMTQTHVLRRSDT